MRRLRDWTKESIIIDPEYINKDVTRETCPSFCGIAFSSRAQLDARIQVSFIRENAIIYIYIIK